MENKYILLSWIRINGSKYWSINPYIFSVKYGGIKMVKLWNEQQLEKVLIPNEVKKSIKEAINILDESYGADRKIDEDLGGYILIVEKEVDIKAIKENLLKDIIPEYTDNISEDYTSSLFLLSSDFAVIVIAPKGLLEELLK